MKQLFSLVAAGIIGGLISIAIISPKLNPSQNSFENTSPHAVFTSYGNNNAATGVTFDFKTASKIAVPSVVNIDASESEELASQRFKDQGSQSPFGELFGSDIFEEFGRGFGFGGGMFNQPKKGTGSGVIIAEDGYIVTNNHVVGFADKIKVTLADDREFIATKIGTDPSTDLAVLKIDAYDLPAIPMGDSGAIEVGEWVLAVGNPFSYLSSTVTAGIVSAKGRDINIINADKAIEEFIQTDAAINPGNSGGALVDVQGNLIGINTAIATPTGVFAGYSFAIPINLASKIIKDIIANGDIERANLGIRGFDIDAEIAKEHELHLEKGILIAELEPGSGAKFSGLLPRDIIIGANGQKVDNFDDLVDIMKFSKVGDTIDLEIIRKGIQKTIPIKIKKKA